MATDENILNHHVKQRLELFMYGRGLIDAEISIVQATVENPNLLDVIWEVTISGKDVNDDDIKYNWILKTATLAEVIRKFAQVDRLFKREMNVYTKLIPLYRGLLEENNILEPFFVTPQLHLHFTDTYEESLFLENMNFHGFRTVKSSEPCSFNHAALAMKALGRLHALSYALREYKPEEFKKFAEYTKNHFHANANVDLYNKHIKLCCERVLETLDSKKDRSALTLFKEFMEKPLEYQMEAVKMSGMGAYAVITHGDATLDNMLFKYGDPDKPDVPTDICLLDWQFCRFGSPALDLSQFLFVTTDKQFRKKYYTEMIRTYYYSLCSYLSELKCDADKTLPFDILLLQLKRYSVYGLCMAILTLHILMSGSKIENNTRKNASDADIEYTLGKGVTNMDSYRKRIRDIVLDYKEYGYFEFLN